LRLNHGKIQSMQKVRGFTLLEVMVVLAIVAILATLAAPSLRSQIQSSTISSNVNTFMADMRFARSESIRRGGGVVMCRSDDPEAASPACGSGSGPGTNGWVSGWIIFHDLDNNGTKAAAEPLLRVQSPITSMDSISDSGNSTKFEFTATGRQKLSGATSFQFGGGNYDNTTQRKVCVNFSGRARVAGDGTSSCSTDQ
jgi:type IV fimbrial biogenesis protein FimT